MIKVEVSAISRSAARLHRAADSALKGLALNAAAHLSHAATARTPVDTGRLRAAWVAIGTGPLSAEVRNPTPYASFVEFDTRHWISRNIVPGQRFLHSAMEETKEALPAMVKERLQEVIGRCLRD